MFDIKRAYLYCMGESVLDKRKFSEDTALNRQQQRASWDQLSQLQQMNRIQRPNMQGDVPQPQMPMPRFMQGIVQFMARPLALVQQMSQGLQRLVQLPLDAMRAAAQMTGAKLESAVSQILTFFFGFKKDKTEEKEKREQHNFFLDSLTGERKVEESHQGNMGGGQ